MSNLKKLITKYGPKVVGLGLNISNVFAPAATANKTLDIFCTPRGGRIKSHQKKFLRKFDKHALKLDDKDIMTYHYAGNGPTILLAHGWESNSFRWRKLFKHLQAADFNIVAMDGPAHGNSGSDRFTALLYAQMMKVVTEYYNPQVLCGHSIGGMASIICLHQFDLPSVRKAVILASPDKLTDITNNYFNIIGGSNSLRSSYEKNFVAVFGKPIDYYSSASFASEFSLPALVVHDKEDSINKFDEGERIHRSWEGSELFVTHGLGHSLQNKEVHRKVVDFCLK